MFTKYDLAEAGFELIAENPGIERDEWAQAMIDCNAEIVDDVFGISMDTMVMLEDAWDCDDYEDPDTGICLTLSSWAEFFSTPIAIEIYSELREIIKGLSTSTLPPAGTLSWG